MKMISLVIIINYIIYTQGLTIPESQCKTGCQSQIYCTGELLKDVQISQVYNNSKEFVDLKLLKPEETIILQYQQFKASNPNPTKEKLKSFIDQFFAEDGLEKCQLRDFNENPLFLQSIVDEKYRIWMYNVIKIWNELAGKVPSDVQQHPENHSYLYIPNCFIKAGGFFTEMYYWDSYWIMQGLLINDMYLTARDIIENFLHLVRTLGYVPNGNRKYYIGRSQPPLLIRMMDYYLYKTNDKQLLVDNIEVLETEFTWWQKNRMVDVTKNGKTYKMGRYSCEICEPRPEGYLEDYNLAQQIKSNDISDKQELMKSIRSTAESGWDFTTKHMRPGLRTDETFSLLNLDTRNIIMVELNAMLQFNAVKLSQWYKCLNNNQKSSYYRQIADDLFEAIQKVLWNEEDGIWYDWDLVTNTQRKNFYPSNFTPLWTHSFEKSQIQADRILYYLAKEEIISKNHLPFYYGIPTSKCNSTQQWDFVNEWAPLQAIIIEGLLNIEDEKTDELASALSALWLKTNYIGFQKSGHMYEKYSAIVIGESGNGGQYTPQIGFGWSNGFSMVLMDMYGKTVSSRDYDDFIPAPAPKQCPLITCD